MRGATHSRPTPYYSKFLHPKTRQTHQSHRKDATEESSRLCLADALSPPKRSSGVKLSDKLSTQETEYSEHLYWIPNDLFGAYHRRKISSKFPIPGVSIKSSVDRLKRREEKEKRQREAIVGRCQVHTKAIKHRFQSSINAQEVSTSARAISRLLKANKQANEQRAALYNADPDTNPKERFDTKSAYEFQFLDVPYSHVNPDKFRYGVLPASRRQQLQDLWNLQSAPVQPSGRLTDKQLLGRSESEKSKNWKLHTRLVHNYGSRYRQHNMKLQQTRRDARTLANKMRNEEKRRRKEALQKQKYWEMYRKSTTRSSAQSA